MRLGRYRLLGLLASFLIIFSSQGSTWGQPPSLPGLELPRFNLPASITSDIATGEVTLDGRRLFVIAVPAVKEQNKQQGGSTALQSRIQQIETNLRRIANSEFDPAKLQVTSTIDANSNLPVISVNNQYLMTVTTLDAQLQGQEPGRQADEWVQVIKNALIVARQERQPNFLMQQGAFGSGILLGMVLSSWGTARLQRKLRDQQKQLRADTPEPPADFLHLEGSPEAEQADRMQQRLIRQRQWDLKDMQRRLLQLTQAAIWGYGCFLILGLFPYSRGLQPLVLSTPLKLLGTGLGIYLVIRLCNLLIDRFINAFQTEDFLAPEASQRIALRVSTFSRVLKSIATLVCMAIGILTILSLLGIQIVPLLAGAGIIGIGISLASQNLIKDMINGFLILLEDQFAVGDVISVGNVSGLVESMNLRITQIRNSEGRLITIPNGTIGVVENLSKDWSRVDLAIVIAYDTNVNQAIEIIQQVGQRMNRESEWQSKILEPPEVLGIDDLNNTGVTIRVWIKTQPLQQWNVGREFRRRLKVALDERGISIGVPQQAFQIRAASDIQEKIPEPRDGKGVS